MFRQARTPFGTRTTDNTCVSSSTSVSVDAQPTPPAAATASTTIQPTCAIATGTVVVTAPTGAVEYNIDGGTYQASGTFAGVSAGSHTILVRSTADNTCVSSSTSVSVDAQPTPPAAATASTTIQPTCAIATGTVVVTAPTGAVEYNIDGGTYQASGTLRVFGRFAPFWYAPPIIRVFLREQVLRLMPNQLPLLLQRQAPPYSLLVLWQQVLLW
ncbi:MAG: hypothetical protein IPN94_09960 [Sphingobacteriales bacterium]|nr:hypothetical protein [Sphingobacteriales bacterium]